uniref:Uncharacterized protein n=1 Tax=Anguilla anguilla TaxID=7936 RepID=A0A0E9T629_ANGAN
MEERAGYALAQSKRIFCEGMFRYYQTQLEMRLRQMRVNKYYGTVTGYK